MKRIIFLASVVLIGCGRSDSAAPSSGGQQETTSQGISIFTPLSKTWTDAYSQRVFHLLTLPMNYSTSMSFIASNGESCQGTFMATESNGTYHVAIQSSAVAKQICSQDPNNPSKQICTTYMDQTCALESLTYTLVPQGALINGSSVLFGST